MPIFEFVCSDCGLPFEELVMSSNKTNELTCPACDSPNITKQISTFASKINGSGTFSSFSSSTSSCSSAGSV
jgi:putative FmdB family regulatory protein